MGAVCQCFQRARDGYTSPQKKHFATTLERMVDEQNLSGVKDRLESFRQQSQSSDSMQRELSEDYRDTVLRALNLAIQREERVMVAHAHNALSMDTETTAPTDADCLRVAQLGLDDVIREWEPRIAIPDKQALFASMYSVALEHGRGSTAMVLSTKQGSTTSAVIATRAPISVDV